jgi:hypothetical protein
MTALVLSYVLRCPGPDQQWKVNLISARRWKTLGSPRAAVPQVLRRSQARPAVLAAEGDPDGGEGGVAGDAAGKGAPQVAVGQVERAAVRGDGHSGGHDRGDGKHEAEDGKAV